MRWVILCPSRRGGGPCQEGTPYPQEPSASDRDARTSELQTEAFNRLPAEFTGMSQPTKIVLGTVGVAVVVGVALLAGITL